MKKYLSKQSLFALVSAFLVLISAVPSKATPPEEAIGYWTEAAIRSAKPVILMMDRRTGIADLSIDSTATTSTSATSTSTAWSDSSSLPMNAVGKIFFTIGRSNYVCSGSTLSDSVTSVSYVVTAGHCAVDKGKFVTNFMFVPNYQSAIFNGKIEVNERWYAKNLVVRNEFASQVQFNRTAIEHDWAFAVIPSGTFTKNKKSFTNPGDLSSKGAFDYGQSIFALGSSSDAFGYPAAGKYAGNTALRYASGSISADPYGYNTWGMLSDLTGGASGGPWLSTLDLASIPQIGVVSSVNSYKYIGDETKMYGPWFGPKTTSTYDLAKNIAANDSRDLVDSKI